ncbi:hypothetical protein ONZ45_g8155 [Pleurotus djamor]|nr:hypothetical protein ONZ45_g8155 [Pleurotus djamor]
MIRTTQSNNGTGPTAFGWFISFSSLVYSLFAFSNPSAIMPTLIRFIHNLHPGKIGNADTAEFYGDGIHNLAIRLAALVFLAANPNLHGSQMPCAVEWIVHMLTTNEYMGRITATSINFTLLRVKPADKDAINAWLNNKIRSCPKALADVMETHAWAIFWSAGLAALVDHYLTALRVPMSKSLNSFFAKWNNEGEHGFLYDSECAWSDLHNSQLDQNHIRVLKARIAGKETEELQIAFKPLTDALSPIDMTFDSRGNLGPGFIYLANTGFALLDCLFRLNIDLALPQHRASLKRGANFGTCLRKMVLCDESLAYILDNALIYTFPPEANPTVQVKAQIFSIAVILLYAQQNDRIVGTLSYPLKALVEMGHEIILQAKDPQLIPQLPLGTPYPVDPQSSSTAESSAIPTSDFTFRSKEYHLPPSTSRHPVASSSSTSAPPSKVRQDSSGVHNPPRTPPSIPTGSFARPPYTMPSYQSLSFAPHPTVYALPSLSFQSTLYATPSLYTSSIGCLSESHYFPLDQYGSQPLLSAVLRCPTTSYSADAAVVLPVLDVNRTLSAHLRYAMESVDRPSSSLQ